MERQGISKAQVIVGIISFILALAVGGVSYYLITEFQKSDEGQALQSSSEVVSETTSPNEAYIHY